MEQLASKLLSEVPGVTHGFLRPGEEPEAFVRCHQIHSDIMISADGISAEALQTTKGDGLSTTETRAVAVQTADCLPVLFAQKQGKRVAAVHAGWRGLHQGILLRAVEDFARAGARAAELVVAIGPAIGPCCFEVSREVIEEFERDWGKLWTARARPWSESQPPSSMKDRSQAPVSANNLWIDLDRIARLQLGSVGVPDAQIEDVGHCTYCGPLALASFRRGTHESQKSGRQWSWIRKTKGQ